jgi:ankyrin repeat protein
MPINYLIILALCFFQSNQGFWRTSPKCAKDNAGINDFTQDGLKELISLKGPRDQTDTCGNTALMYAAGLEDMATLMLLIQAGAHINLKNSDGNTALHVGLLLCKLQAIKALIEAKANLDIQNREGDTPLHLAIAAKNTDAFSFLISYGANLAAKDKKGRTAKALAFEIGDSKILEIIENFNRIKKLVETKVPENSGKSKLTLYDRYPKTVLFFTALTGLSVLSLYFLSNALGECMVAVVKGYAEAIGDELVKAAAGNPQQKQ